MDIPSAWGRTVAVAWLLLVVAVSTTGCPAAGASLFRPRFDRISTGMTKEQVVAALGRPGEVAATGGSEFLIYGWDDPTDGRIAVARRYVVQLDAGRVVSYMPVGATGQMLNVDVTVH